MKPAPHPRRRRIARSLGVAAVCLIALAGCRSSDPGWSISDLDPAHEVRTPNHPSAVATGPIVAYVAGEPLRRDALWPALSEAAGQVVLDEFVLDLALKQRLDREAWTITDEDLEAERSLLSAALSDDPDEAARLLDELRERRGLGDDRFQRLLRRNAALRKLVADDVVVSETQVRQSFLRRHGPTFRVRLLTADDPRRVRELRQRVLAGEPFGELAATHSTDASRDRGGLLTPINPLDPTYPQAVRTVLPTLDLGIDAGLSPIVALDGGYALLQLVEALPADGVAFEDVADQLRADARTGNERLLMQQLANALREDADVLIVDRALGAAVGRE